MGGANGAVLRVFLQCFLRRSSRASSIPSSGIKLLILTGSADLSGRLSGGHI